MTGKGADAQVADSVRDLYSQHFRAKVLPGLMEKHGFLPGSDAGLGEGADFGVAHSIGAALGMYGGKTGQEQRDLIVPIYHGILEDVKDWDPETQTRKVKNKATGEVGEAPLDFPHFVANATMRWLKRLENGEEPPKDIEYHRRRFLKQFTAGLGPKEAEAADAVLAGRRDGTRLEDLVYHPDLPPEFRHVEKIRPLYDRMTEAAERYRQETGENVFTPPPKTGSTEAEDLDSSGGGSLTVPVTQGDIERRIGASTALEDEKRRDIAELWMNAHLDQAGMQVYQAHAAGQPLDRLRRKYGDDAVEQREQEIRELLPHFHEYVNSGYKMPDAGMQRTSKVTAPAKNILPIKRVKVPAEMAFLKQFTAGMGPEEKQAAETIYFARRSGMNSEDLVGHVELPPKYRPSIRQIKPLSARISAAAQKFSRETGNDVWSKIKPDKSAPRAAQQIYISEKEHHPGIERFMRAKLADIGSPPEMLKVLQQSLMNTSVTARLFDDPELKNVAERQYQERVAGYGRGVGPRPTNARAIVLKHYNLFKEWLPEYFDSIGKPDLAEEYRQKFQAMKAAADARVKTKLGLAPGLSKEERTRRRVESGRKTQAARVERRQKVPIERDSLNLDQLPGAFQEAFSQVVRRGGSRNVALANQRAKLAMLAVSARLEGESLEQISQKPDVKAILHAPGFFFTTHRTEQMQRTPQRDYDFLQGFWQRLVMPVIGRVSPTLSGLMKMHHKKFAVNYYPLSQTPEIGAEIGAE